jgi:hypothetical protein
MASRGNPQKTSRFIAESQLGVSENVVYPFLPNGFADLYPY